MNTTVVFPLAESTYVVPGKAQFLAVCVKDTCEVLIPGDNPDFEFFPGDKVYATVGTNNIFYINDHGDDFSLGTCILHCAHQKSGPIATKHTSVVLALDVQRL